MENVVVHIISHSHWDREWYLPFESHRMQLVELFWQSFGSFWKWSWVQELPPRWTNHCPRWLFRNCPENRDKVQRYIDEGKLKIGPFYILQDDYLISSEANVRQYLDWPSWCAKWVNQLRLVTFQILGNISKLPQILKIRYSRSILVVVSNRSALTTKSLKQFNFNFLRCTGKVWMVAVLGILLANWYSNGNEIQ